MLAFFWLGWLWIHAPAQDSAADDAPAQAGVRTRIQELVATTPLSQSDELFTKLQEFSPEHAWWLRQTLIDHGRWRPALLRQIMHAGPYRKIALEILCAQAGRLTQQTLPFREASVTRRDRLPLVTPAGLRVRMHVPEELALSRLELLRLYQEAEMLSAPVVVFPALRSSLRAPFFGIFPWQSGEWLLRSRLESPEITMVRMPRAIWVLPAEHANRVEADLPDEESACQQELVRRETELTRQSLLELAELRNEDRAMAAAELLDGLGLIVAERPVHDSLSTGLTLLEFWRDPLHSKAEPLPAAPAPVWVSWWARALARRQQEPAFVQALPPRVRDFVTARLWPQHCRRAAATSLARPGPWTMPALAGSGPVLIADAKTMLGAVVRGQVPLWHGIRIDRDQRATLASLELADTAPQQLRYGIVAGRLEAPELVTTRVARLGYQLAAGETPPVEQLWALLQAAETRTSTGEVLCHFGAAPIVVELFRRVLEGGINGALNNKDRAELTSILLNALAARADQDGLLVGQCREVVRQVKKHAGAPLEEPLTRLMEQLWLLRTVARTPEWALDLTEYGWVPAG